VSHDGTIEQFKTGLVARGFSRAYGLDYLETLASTVRMDTLQLFVAIIAFEDLECWHFDNKNTFRDSKHKEKIYF
jgi:hypothetical protein